jgi:hypothetical protein
MQVYVTSSPPCSFKTRVHLSGIRRVPADGEEAAGEAGAGGATVAADGATGDVIGTGSGTAIGVGVGTVALATGRDGITAIAGEMDTEAASALASGLPRSCRRRFCMSRTYSEISAYPDGATRTGREEEEAGEGEADTAAAVRGLLSVRSEQRRQCIPNVDWLRHCEHSHPSKSGSASVPPAAFFVGRLSAESAAALRFRPLSPSFLCTTSRSAASRVPRLPVTYGKNISRYSRVSVI